MKLSCVEERVERGSSFASIIVYLAVASFVFV